jgi:NitT/TauT family transport system ATP-binding protein
MTGMGHLIKPTFSATHKPAGEGRVEIDAVSITFGQGAAAHRAVETTTITLEPGEFVCLLGPSGCGKSSLLNAVAGHVHVTEGAIRVDGAEVRGPGSDRGMVFQQYSLLPWKTIRDNIALGPRLAGASAGIAAETASTFLNLIGLSRFADRYPAELSGGMQQRVGIARALANYPRVLLMDEPFGALDAQTRLVMQENLLSIWKKFRTTVLFVTHDVDEAIFLADRVLVMSAAPGRIIADLTVPLPRPRLPEMATEPGFVETKRECLSIIREQSLRAFEEQDA